MMNGFKSGCLAGDEPTLNAMRSHPDWVQAALDREMVQEPGASFCYDSPGMHLLSAILQKATGMTAVDFARQNLFEPLGIREVFWESDPQGYTHGWGDLYLTPRDAAKIGYLWLNTGCGKASRSFPRPGWQTRSRPTARRCGRLRIRLVGLGRPRMMLCLGGAGNTSRYIHPITRS